jgi:hypothetical protein
MRTKQTSTARKSIALVPFLLGWAGLFLSVAYQAQRSGVFLHSFYSLDRFIQHHLDAVASLASLAAILGLGGGLVILRIRGRSRIVTYGTVFALAVLLWSVFGLSL